MPPKVATPLLKPWIEQPGFLACSRVDASQIRALVMVVCETCQSEIAENRFAAMLLSDDVVNLKRRGRKPLGQSTILAATISAPANMISDFRLHAITTSLAVVSRRDEPSNAEFR